MFDLEAAIEYANNETDHSITETYDIIRSGIQKGKRSIILSIGYCGASECCDGKTTELHIDRLIRDKFKVDSVQGKNSFYTGSSDKRHYQISGWSQTKRKRVKVDTNAG